MMQKDKTSCDMHHSVESSSSITTCILHKLASYFSVAETAEPVFTNNLLQTHIIYYSKQDQCCCSCSKILSYCRNNNYPASCSDSQLGI